MKLFKRHFKMTNLSVSKAHKLFRKLLPKRRFGIIIGNRHPFGVLSLSLHFSDYSSSFVSCGCSLGKQGTETFKRALSRVSKSLNSRTSLAVGGTNLHLSFGGFLRFTPPVLGLFWTTAVSLPFSNLQIDCLE